MGIFLSVYDLGAVFMIFQNDQDIIQDNETSNK